MGPVEPARVVELIPGIVYNVGTRLVAWYSIVAIFFPPYSVP